MENIGEELKLDLQAVAHTRFGKSEGHTRGSEGETFSRRRLRGAFVVSHYPPKNHILPLKGNLSPGWEPLL